MVFLLGIQVYVPVVKLMILFIKINLDTVKVMENKLP